MSKLMVVMKDEIRRIARKEIRAAIGGLKKDRTLLKRSVAELKKGVIRDRKILNALAETVARQARQVAAPPPQDKARITAKGIRALRRKLKMSQVDFGKLVGVNALSVMKWEHKTGALQIRDQSRKALLAIRNIGVREARLRLGRR